MSRPAALTVAPWEREREPKPALPTINEPAICQVEVGPVTLTEEPEAAAVLAMVAVPVSTRLDPWAISSVADLLVRTVTVAGAPRSAPGANFQAPPPPNDNTAAVPAPVMAPLPLLNSAVSIAVGADDAGF